MSFNMKEFAEALLKSSATEQNYQEIVSKMKSTNNTLSDDIDKLRDGAKLECKVDINKIIDGLNSIGNYVDSSETELSNVKTYIEDVEESLSYLQDATEDLRVYLDELTYEVKEEK